mmetsp:Transcript_24906/g.64658  ORF Transcript_24906/g.64658 Transcript_24906/m.64658 type:complete len:359 (+) Transcript_24906:477-1553(+)
MNAVRAIASRSRAAASLALARARAATARAAAARRGAEPEAFSSEGGAGATRARASPSHAAPSEDRPPARLLRVSSRHSSAADAWGGAAHGPSPNCAAALDKGDEGSVSLKSSSSSKPGWQANNATRAVRRPRASNRRRRFRLKVAHLGLMWKHHAFRVVAAALPQAASSSSKRPSLAKSNARAWKGATLEAWYSLAPSSSSLACLAGGSGCCCGGGRVNGCKAPHAVKVRVTSPQSSTEPKRSAACLARWARSLGVMGAPAAFAVARIKPAASGARSPVVFWSSSSELMASSAELELSLESSRSILEAARLLLLCPASVPCDTRGRRRGELSSGLLRAKLSGATGALLRSARPPRLAV